MMEYMFFTQDNTEASQITNTTIFTKQHLWLPQNKIYLFILCYLSQLLYSEPQDQLQVTQSC